MSEIHAWPKPTGKPVDAPKKIIRPCDWGLVGTITDLETQLGTIEAYNRLVSAASNLRARINRGDIKAQNPLYAKSIKGG